MQTYILMNLDYKCCCTCGQDVTKYHNDKCNTNITVGVTTHIRQSIIKIINQLSHARAFKINDNVRDRLLRNTTKDDEDDEEEDDDGNQNANDDNDDDDALNVKQQQRANSIFKVCFPFFID
mgnify:FL=1